MKWPRQWRRRASSALLAGLASCASEAGPELLTIELQRGPALRESGDSVTFPEFVGMIAAPGGYVAARVEGSRMVAFYDTTGRITRLVGTKGSGPGEFQEITGLAVARGDSLYIGDWKNGRVSVFAPGELRFVRSFPTSVIDAGFRGTPHGLILPMGVARGRATGMQRYSPRFKSWDGAVTSVAPSIPDDMISGYAAADSGRFWIAERGAYTIRLVRGDSVLRTISREAAWFPRDTNRVRGIGSHAFIAHMQVDERGLLWVLLRRPNPAWKRGPVIVKPGMQPRQFPPLGEVYVGVLDVLDPVSGRLVATLEVPGDMMDFLGPRLLYQRTDADSSGALMLQVWRASLTGRGSE